MIYDLFAISNHYGSLGGGHYTAYCKYIMNIYFRKDNEGWFEYDDSSFNRISESSLAASSSYVLFYMKR